MRTRWLGLGLGLVLASPVVAAIQNQQPAPPQTQEKDWRQIARQDVQAAYELYVANHPGMHDPLNPGFAEQLKRARDAGMAVAEGASTQADYAEALGAFTAELSDGHAVAFAKQPSSSEPPKFEWPSFVAAWRGDRMVVQHALAGTPAPIGVEIVSCDGMPVKELVLKRLGYRGFRPGEAGHWWFRGPQAFYSTPRYSAHRPQRCTFRTPSGQEYDAPLSYTPAPKDFMTLIERATDGERTPIGLTEPRDGIYLIGMPTFSPNPDEVKTYRQLFETLAEHRPELKSARAIVIDLRFNNGGSSSWSREAARQLWGKQAFDERIEDYFKKVRIWWRASEDNVAYMSELEARIRADGNTANADSVGKTGKAMKEALANGEKFYVQGDDKADKVYPEKFAQSDFATPVHVITPGRCASACLDAVDAFKLFPNVKLIGAPTSADSTYMEVRATDLPSGEGRIVIPTKVWMHRPRGSGEVYMPDIMVTDPDWSTKTFLDRIEADLASR